MGKNKKIKESAYFLDKIKHEVTQRIDIGELCKDYMRIYGHNVNIMRHIPLMYDGLKPGERRILYIMYMNKVSYNSRYKKCSGLVGATLSIHPHGDTPVYDTLVKMSQKWNTTMPLVDGHGNFGAAKGDRAAAYRYTEARLTFFAWKAYFEDFDAEILDMMPTNTGEMEEPEFLPAKYPMGIINGTTGIGYGKSCIIPPHNFNEVIDATIALLEDPTSEILLIPDLPTGCDIVDNGELKEINDTGRGKLVMRGKMIKPGDNSVSILSTPWQSFFNKILVSVLELMDSKKITGIKDFQDNNKEDKLNYKILLKKEVDPNKIIDTIFTSTSMESTKPVSLRMIDNYDLVDYNNKQFLLEWIEKRIEVKRRFINHKLIKLKEKEHVLDTLNYILRDEVYESTTNIIKNSEDRRDIIDNLMDAYGLTSLQAGHIAGLKVTSFTRASARKYKLDAEEVKKEIAKVEKIAKSTKRIVKVIIEELEEGKKLFGSPRKSDIIKVSGEVVIPDTRHVVIITEKGNIKKLSNEVENIGYIEQGDTPVDVIVCNNRDELLIFDKLGKICRLPVHEIDNTAIESKGDPISRYINVSEVCRIIQKPDTNTIEKLEKKNGRVYVLMITERGIIKKTDIKEYMGIKNERKGIVIKDGDKLKTIKILLDDKDIIVYSSEGKGIRFNSSQITETSRMTIGVKSMEIDDNDKIVGMELVNQKDNSFAIITEKGNGKICTLSTFDTSDRNGKSTKLITTDKTDSVVYLSTLDNTSETIFNIYMKNDLIQVSSNDFPELARLSKGKKIIPVRKGDSIINIRTK